MLELKALLTVTLENYSDEIWDRVIEINLKGLLSMPRDQIDWTGAASPA
jgi:hypothetical protein